MLAADQLAVLRHALGVAEDGSGSVCRNHFVAAHDDVQCRALVALGLMKQHPMAPELTGGGVCFVVTAAGREAVTQHAPRPKRLTRDQRRYRDWLRADCGLSFGDWLKRGGSSPPTVLTAAGH